MDSKYTFPALLNPHSDRPALAVTELMRLEVQDQGVVGTGFW